MKLHFLWYLILGMFMKKIPEDLIPIRTSASIMVACVSQIAPVVVFSDQISQLLDLPVGKKSAKIH